MFEYRATVTKVYDGDTVTVDIDLGFGIWMRGQTIRLYGIDAPEVRGKERKQGLVARDRLRELILDKDIKIKTHKDKKGKYGRWLAEIHVKDSDGITLNICDELVITGLAEYREY